VQQVGIDIIEVSRISRMVERWGDVFLQRVYTQPELKKCGMNMQSLAARFSGKEAVIKALSARSLSLKDIEIFSQPDGKPIVRLHGRARSIARDKGFSSMNISLSHCHEYACACAVGETAASIPPLIPPLIE
jgi:holo-[acyl-carrier protein] synthase